MCHLQSKFVNKVLVKKERYNEIIFLDDAKYHITHHTLPVCADKGILLQVVLQPKRCVHHHIRTCNHNIIFLQSTQRLHNLVNCSAWDYLYLQSLERKGVH